MRRAAVAVWLTTAAATPLGAALLIAAPALAGPAPATSRIRLGEIRFQLYQELSGTLSAPVKPGFSFWNTGAGEGDAQEPASDYLISVPLSSTTGEAESSDTPLTVTVRNAAGRTLATRTSKFQLVPYRGQTFFALWLADSPCVGPIMVTASYGRQRKTARFSLDCGE